jgi:hypothetical protein
MASEVFPNDKLSLSNWQAISCKWEVKSFKWEEINGQIGIDPWSNGKLEQRSIQVA